MDLPASTLRTILANRSKIESSAMTSSCKRQKIKHGKFDELEHILLEWFNQASTLNLPVNGNIVTEKHMKLLNVLILMNFLDLVAGLIGSRKGMVLYIDKFMAKQSPIMTLISLHGVKIFCRIF